LANHKSALKRARQDDFKRLRNMSYKTRMKNAVKQVRSSVANNAADEAKERLVKAIAILQKTASKGVIHRKNASRKISRLTKQVNQLSSS
jgi:small subunit ribosomal protein S20